MIPLRKCLGHHHVQNRLRKSFQFVQKFANCFFQSDLISHYVGRVADYSVTELGQHFFCTFLCIAGLLLTGTKEICKTKAHSGHQQYINDRLPHKEKLAAGIWLFHLVIAYSIPSSAVCHVQDLSTLIDTGWRAQSLSL